VSDPAAGAEWAVLPTVFVVVVDRKEAAADAADDLTDPSQQRLA
jgi:hypothetical protein